MTKELPKSKKKVGTTLYTVAYWMIGPVAKSEMRTWEIVSICRSRRTSLEVKAGIKKKPMLVKAIDKVDGITFVNGEWRETVLAHYPEYITEFDVDGEPTNDLWTTPLAATNSALIDLKKEISDLNIALETSPDDPELIEELRYNKAFHALLSKKLKRLK